MHVFLGICMNVNHSTSKSTHGLRGDELPTCK